MKHFILFCLVNFIVADVSSQFTFIPKKKIRTIKGTIEKHEGIELKDFIPFSAIRIIDSRYDTTIIGFHLASYLSLRDTASQPLALQHVIDKYYHALYVPGKDTLVIQLEKLSIQDDLISDTNFILTAGYVLCKEYTGSKSSYAYHGSVDTFLKEKFSYKTSFDAHRNGKHINFEFWDYYLLRLCEAMIKGQQIKDSLVNDTSQKFTIEQIKQEGLQKRNKPILTSSRLNPGFYHNFSEFVNNSPGFTYDSGSALPKLLDIMHYRVGKNISYEEPDTSYWGFCNGTNLYVRYGYCFYQLERKDANFYIAPTLDGVRQQNSREGWNILIGLASLSAGIANKDGLHFEGFSAVPQPNIPMVALPLDGTYILGLQLNLDTGNITW